LKHAQLNKTIYNLCFKQILRKNIGNLKSTTCTFDTHKINNLKIVKMKKYSIVFALSLSIFVTLFQSCNNATNEKIAIEETNDLEIAKLDNPKDAMALNMQNMQDAFKGETTASAKYEAFSIKANEEGLFEIALLFKAASVAEKIHADNHKIVIEKAGQTTPEITPEFTVKSTKENLENAIEGESYEFFTMYPEFIKNANKAGNYMAQISLTYAYKVEQKHRDFYMKALVALENNNVKSLPRVYFLCPTCGNTYETVAPKRCEISMTNANNFIRLDSLN
jgi:rubrerythrin